MQERKTKIKFSKITLVKKILAYNLALIIAAGLVYIPQFQRLPIPSVYADETITKKVDTFTSSGTWTAPAGVTSVVVEAWGAGGGGSTAVGGGGGGAYSKSTVGVTPANNYDVVVGTSAANTNGGDSTFATTTVVAKGGKSGTNGSAGGLAAEGTGSTKFGGGNGVQGNGNQGAGGGAGDTANGSNGSGSSSGSGGASNGGAGSTGASAGRGPGGGGSSAAASQQSGARGEVRVTYTVTTTTGFPAVQERAWGRNTSNSTSHTITMPSGIEVGDLLLIIFSSDGNPTASISSGNWTKISQDSNTTEVTQAVFWKTAEGSDTATVTTTASEQSSHVVFRIDNASTPTLTFANGAAGTIDPPTHTPAGSDKYLWLTGMSMDDGGPNISAAPTNYTSLLIQPENAGTSSVKMAVSERVLEASSENPGTYTTSAAENWVASTIAVPPEAADPDTTPPVPGNSGTITTASVAGTSLILNWTEATDDVSDQADIQYEVRKSSSNNIDSVANIEANGTIIRSYTADISSFNVTGLSPETQYYFNVIAKDEAGNKVAYTMKSETTTDAPPSAGSVLYHIADMDESVASGAVGWFSVVVSGGGDMVASSESRSQYPHRMAGTFSRLGIRVYANDRGASTLELRKNGSTTAMTVTIPAGQTGWFENTTDSVHFAAGDLINTRLLAGSGGTTLRIGPQWMVFTPDSGLGYHAGTFANWSASSGTRYTSPMGIGGNTTDEASESLLMKIDGTVTHMQAYWMDTRDDGASYLTLRKNTADGNHVLTVPQSAVEGYDYVAATDTFVAGDKLSIKHTTDGTDTINYSWLQFAIESDDNRFEMGSATTLITPAASAVRYLAFADLDTHRSTESDVQLQSPMRMDLNYLRAYVRVNSITNGVDSTLALRVNGADAKVLTIPGGTTGWVEFGDSPVTIEEGDKINFALTVGATGTTLELNQVMVTANEAPITTLADGTNPSNSTVAPETAITDLDSFTLATDTGTDSITALTVTLANGTYEGLSEVRITSDNGSTTYFSAVSNPSANAVNFSGGTPIPVTTTPTQFKVRITPKTHANMAVPPGASHAVTGTVTAFTSTNDQSGSDTASATITVDNLSPANVTLASGTAGDEEVELSWTNPVDADFSNVIILRNTSAVSDTPTEGTSPAVDATIGTSTVRYILNGTSFTDTALTNGTAYHYKIFAKDSNGNYSATGVVPTGSPFTPVAPTPPPPPPSSGGGGCCPLGPTPTPNPPTPPVAVPPWTPPVIPTPLPPPLAIRPPVVSPNPTIPKPNPPPLNAAPLPNGEVETDKKENFWKRINSRIKTTWNNFIKFIKGLFN